MPIDEGYLQSLQTFEDRNLGVRETFLRPSFGENESIAVLSTPTGAARGMGWVICHSLGMEQMHMQRFEVAVARALAAEGFPVMRYHSQGYGDSHGSSSEVSLESHLRDAVAAGQLLASSEGIVSIGFIGARFGGLVAALAATQLKARGLVLWDPAVSGRRYLSSVFRWALVTNLAGRGRDKGDGVDPRENLRRGDVFDLQGFPLREQVNEEIASFDLLQALPPWQGECLVVQISTSPTPRADLQRLAGRLEELGAKSALEVVVDPAAATFGQKRYRIMDSWSKSDTHAALSDSLTKATVSWCQRLPDQGFLVPMEDAR